MSKKEIIGIYLRVSTSNQMKGVSLEFQERDGIKYCNDNGYDYVVFNEGSVSGKKYNREVWLDFENKILNKELDGVYFWDFDRMFRGYEVEYYFLKLVERVKFKIISGNRSYDLNTESDYSEFRFKGMMGDFDRKKIIKRTKRGREYNWERGMGYSGRCGYGYKRKKINGIKEIIIDKKESDVIKDIYKIFLRKDVKSYKDTFYRIRKKYGEVVGVDRDGNEIKTINRIQSISQIQKILKDDKFLGIYKMYSKEFNKVFEFKFGRIIEDEIFVKVQEKIEYLKGLRKVNSVNDYLLKGKIKCKDCDGRMWVEGSGKKDRKVGYKYYKCSSVNGGIGSRIIRYNNREIDKDGNYNVIDKTKFIRKINCISNGKGDNRVNVKKLEKIVWDGLFVILRNSEEIKNEYNSRFNRNLGLKDDNVGKLKSYEGKLGRLEVKYNKMLNNLSEEILNIEDFNRWKSEKYLIEKEEIENKIVGLNKEIENLNKSEVINDYLLLMEKDLENRYLNKRFSFRRSIIEKYVKNISYKKILNSDKLMEVGFELFLDIDKFDKNDFDGNYKIDYQKKLLILTK